ncbi:glycosyltransferase family 2 protein [Sphingomonas sp. S2-65]|uniref:glycosyltransferase family 2 protein n=1 Tax=Sphingomonas sp. S2-65 TaxID=2903960 RepID=UPI001F3477AF|nr:glycosyltransferase family 2 protein [Sphingomonas sp. S2-65]UYY57066.1 glycosyltransferase [Sphingomonas sp. S2-65]
MSVVIPYYQRRSGVLLGALRSIFDQRLPEGLHLDVIVVDDSSPIPARGDVKLLSDREAAGVRILTQANAGPAAARNAGLDAVPHDARYVAFLDSDDRWHPDHLDTAIAALEEGYDVYFANNWVEPGQDWFSAHPRYDMMRKSLGAADLHLQRLTSGEAVDLLIEEPLLHLSTLVFPARRHGSLRFEDALETGEDHLYSLVLADRSLGIAVNQTPMMARGSDGVNFYRGALDWNSPKSAWRALTTVVKYRRIADLMSHRASITRLAHAKARVSLDELVYLLMRNGMRYPVASFAVAAAAWRRWRWKIFGAIPIAVSLLARRRKGSLEFRT